MTYRGKIKNGAVVLDSPVLLPDGAEVEIIPALNGSSLQPPSVAPMNQNAQDEKQPSLYERYKDFIGIAEGLPSDSSTNHDHYLYGVPKK